MKNLSLSRLYFLPNIFSGLYQAPPSFDPSIPSRMTDIDGMMSFSVMCGSYWFIMFLYAGISLIIFLLTTKYNSNRPLR